MGYIYKITNNVNSKVYIGQTKKTIEERFNQHIKCAKEHVNQYLYDAMNHYGIENFSVSLIEECEDCLLDEKERYWIREHHSWTGDENCTGYNMTVGGGGGDTFSAQPEYRKVEIGKKLSTSNKGKKRTAEQRLRMREGQKKRSKSSYKRKVPLTEEQLQQLHDKKYNKFFAVFDEDYIFNLIRNTNMRFEDIQKLSNVCWPTIILRCQRRFGCTPKQLRKVKTKSKKYKKTTFQDYEKYCNEHKQRAQRGKDSPVYIEIDKYELECLLKKDYTVQQMMEHFQVSYYVVSQRCKDYFGTGIKEARKIAKQRK